MVAKYCNVGFSLRVNAEKQLEQKRETVLLGMLRLTACQFMRQGTHESNICASVLRLTANEGDPGYSSIGHPKHTKPYIFC